MKLFAAEHVYRHNWGTVTTAFWRKYPNQYSEHVKEVDCFKRELDEKTGDMTSSRLIACETALPNWVTALGLRPFAYAYEETVCNAREQRMEVRSRNLTGSSCMVVEEVCTYERHPSNPNWTLYKQEARISAFMPFVTSRLENYSFASMAAKSRQGVEVMEQLCSRLSAHGVQGSFTQLFKHTAVAAAAASAAKF
jgi:hypothetical protein